MIDYILNQLGALTIGTVFVGALHVIGVYLLYHNRHDLLFEDEDNNPNTPDTLSLGRCWSWIMFYIACSFWIRFSAGVIPATTPFPPLLYEMLAACLIYEFAKKGIDIGKIWAQLRGGGSYNNQHQGNYHGGGQYGGNQYGGGSYGGQYSGGSSYGQYPTNQSSNSPTPSYPSPQADESAQDSGPHKAYAEDEGK